MDYAVNRYLYEAIATTRSSTIISPSTSYMVGDTYTIVDMALWGWARCAPSCSARKAPRNIPNVKRLVDEISARPAAARAIALKDKFTFKTEMDDEARNNVRPSQDQGGVNVWSRHSGARRRSRTRNLAPQSPDSGFARVASAPE